MTYKKKLWFDDVLDAFASSKSKEIFICTHVYKFCILYYILVYKVSFFEAVVLIKKNHYKKMTIIRSKTIKFKLKIKILNWG